MLNPISSVAITMKSDDSAKNTPGHRLCVEPIQIVYKLSNTDPIELTVAPSQTREKEEQMGLETYPD